MRRVLTGSIGAILVFGLSFSNANAESTGLMFLSPDQSYCRAYDIDSEANLLSFFRANDTTVKITALPNGMVNATCLAKAQGKNLVRQEGQTTFALDTCRIRQEEGGFETTLIVSGGQVTISDIGEISMTCHGVPEKAQ